MWWVLPRALTPTTCVTSATELWRGGTLPQTRALGSWPLPQGFFHPIGTPPSPCLGYSGPFLHSTDPTAGPLGFFAMMSIAEADGFVQMTVSSFEAGALLPMIHLGTIGAQERFMRGETFMM